MTLLKTKKQRFPWMTGGMSKSFELDDFFEDDFFAANKNLPAMNVIEHEDDFQVEFAVPGFSKEDFEVSIEDDLLYISAENSQENMEDEDGYTRKEFSYANFRRILQLPKSVDTTKEIEAKYQNGILKLNLMKVEEAMKSHKKRIEIL